MPPDERADFVEFTSPTTGDSLRPRGDALVSDGGEQFPIVDGIPRFVPRENYASAFGLQWKAFARTQLDSSTGRPISRQRLERCVGTPLSDLRGKRVLEAGCGAGRFTELLVGAGAVVHSIDLSVAVEANRENVGDRPNYRVAQADIRMLPFPAGSFDLVLCLGVLQHTPSPEESIRSLWSRVRPGGLLVIDHYRWTLNYYLMFGQLAARFVLKRMEPQRAKRVTDRMADLLFPIHWAVGRSYPMHLLLTRLSPMVVTFFALPELSRQEHYEFSKLDTHDGLTDYYKFRRSPAQLRRTLESLGATDIWINRGGNGVEARARKPQGA